MSPTRFIYSRYWRVACALKKRGLARQPGPERIERGDWARSLVIPTEFYLDCFKYFKQRLPSELREHRAYFEQERRGFGEEAMHVMWYLLFQEFKPQTFLEIGVYRGQTTSLAALLARLSGNPCRVQGISPFSSAGDTVSRYITAVDYYQDTLANFARFSLPPPDLMKAYSTDPEAVDLIRSRSWDMIYIDGNHDYEVVLKDWAACSAGLRAGGVVVLDDSGLTTNYKPPIFATAGHPGPSRMAQEIDRQRFTEILQVGHNRVFLKAA